MSDWPVIKLGEVVEITSSKRVKRADYVDSGVPFFRSKEVIERSKGNNISTELFITEDHFRNIETKFGAPLTGDILLTSVGTLGIPYQVQDGDEFYFKDGNLTWFRNFSKRVNPKFLYYWLTSPIAKRKFDEITIGSTQKALTIIALKSLDLRLPPIEVQDNIVQILDSLDGKLTNNRQINQTLEQIAQAIFKSWFVDFEPTRAKIAAKQNGQDPERAAMAAISGKTLDELEQLSPEQQAQLKTTAALFSDYLVNSDIGEIPQGWELAKLSELLDFNPKRTLKKGASAPYLDMKNVPTQGHLAENVCLREMASGAKFINGDTLLARITPCLENGKTAYVDFLDDEQVGWGSTEYIVIRPKNGRPLSLGYMIARLDSFRLNAIQSMTGTSGRQRANANALSELPWLNYPIELLNEFDSIAGLYLAMAKKNGNEIKMLSELRNTLLPKLLSGELDVKGN